MLGDVITMCRRSRPLVHCINNYVTANDCANMLLACGGSAIMADDADEVAEVTAMCNGLVINMGTPNPRKLTAMRIAGERANELGHPVALDPVGVGSSKMRMDAAHDLLNNVKFAVIRGNATEIATLVRGTAAHRGVDADEGAHTAPGIAKALARETGAIVIVSGDTDIVTDGEQVYGVHNGHPMMRLVTGAGCQLSALLGAYVMACPDDVLRASLAAVAAMGLCGEIAHGRLGPLDGNATFRNYTIDAMMNLTPEALDNGARYEKF